MTRRLMTNVEKPEGFLAPMGRFGNLREYPTAAFKAVPAPNADTLYSAAWLDISESPWILQLPDEHGRYYLMPMLEAWTDVFADPGTRTTGTGGGATADVECRRRVSEKFAAAAAALARGKGIEAAATRP
jgi:hypothetical protein